MHTPKALTIAMVLIAGVTASFLLTPSMTRTSLPELTTDPQEAEDPFADMIEEGDGLLAQLKAQAAAMERLRPQA